MNDLLKKGIGIKFLLPIVACYAAAGGLLGWDRISQLQAVIQHLGAAGVVGLFILILQEIVPRSMKEVLVFWRLKDRSPGCRAFSVIAKKDQRVDPSDLAVLLPTALMTPSEENALWYRWLKSVESDPAIADNHRRFLILRECATLLALLTIATPFLAISGYASPLWVSLFTASVLGAYVLAALAARISGQRLVGNVISMKVASS